METDGRIDWSSSTDVFIGGRILRNRRGESGYRKLMGGNGHGQSRRWKTKSSSTRWYQFSTRSGKRTFWAFGTDSGRRVVRIMRWMHSMSGSQARKWTMFWTWTFDHFSTKSGM